ncbi:MAG: hypothetical protein GTO63_34910 [Anaerolineae bacterium]|nr:hypothetical protein [Anaerolineae bacterium]
MSLRDRFDKRPVLLEVIPPGRRASEAYIKRYIEKYLTKALDFMEFDAINIPEIVDENFRGEPFYRNVEPRDFASMGRTACGDREVVVSKIVVHCRGGRPELEDWATATLQGYGIQNVVAVGAYLPDFDYPGPGVLEANEVLKAAGLTCGNVMIPEREGEAQKMLGKTLGGAEFFTTQAVFSSGLFVEVLEGYYALCVEAGISPAAVFASFTPVSEKYDIEFLRWLGVSIDAVTEGRLLAGGKEDLARASIEMALENWRKLQSAASRHKGAVLGLNVEYIHRHNFEPTLDMAKRLVREI